MDQSTPNTNPAPPPPPPYLKFLWACNLAWTLILLSMNVLEFLRGGTWTYQGPGSLIYFATLAAYAGVKEAHNWTQGEGASEVRGRRGTLFVGVWVVFSMGAVLAVNFGQGFVFPHELQVITLEVLGIFFGTQASKVLRRGRNARQMLDPGLVEERIVQLADAGQPIGTNDMVTRLGISRSSVQRTVKKLLREHRLKKVSGGKNDPDTKYQAV